MKWLLEFFNPSAYDHGYRAGFDKGYKEGQDWGHDHDACEHTHPFEEAKAALGMGFAGRKRAPGWGSHAPQTSTKGR